MDRIVTVARAQLQALDDKRATLIKIIALAEGMDTSDAPQMREGAAKPLVRRQSTVTKETLDAIRTILEMHGEPVRLRDLLVGVQQHGVSVGGKNPASTLSARLSNSKEFKSYSGIGWWFTDRPLPNAQHELDEAEGIAHQHAPSASNFELRGPYGTALDE